MLRGRGGRTQTTTRNSTETSTYTPTIFNGPTPATEPASTEPSAPPPAPSSQGGTRNRGNRGHNPRRAGRGTGRASRGSASNRSAVPTGGRRLDESPPSNSTTGRPANRRRTLDNSGSSTSRLQRADAPSQGNSERQNQQEVAIRRERALAAVEQRLREQAIASESPTPDTLAEIRNEVDDDGDSDIEYIELPRAGA